jgi:hypothetical protein
MWLTDCKGVANPTEAAVIPAGVASLLFPPPANVVSGQKKKNPLKAGLEMLANGFGGRVGQRNQIVSVTSGNHSCFIPLHC